MLDVADAMVVQQCPSCLKVNRENKREEMVGGGGECSAYNVVQAVAGNVSIIAEHASPVALRAPSR